MKEKERERGRDKHHKDKDRDRKRKKRNSSSDLSSSPEPKHHSKDKEKEKVFTPKQDELFGGWFIHFSSKHLFHQKLRFWILYVDLYEAYKNMALERFTQL